MFLIGLRKFDDAQINSITKTIVSILFVIISLFPAIAQKSNISSELSIKNAQLIYFQHKIVDRNLSGKDFLLPYLAYIDGSGVPKDYLMDSFVLVDQFYHFYPYADKSTYDGIYEKEYLQSYINDVFKRTKLPVIKANSDFNNVAELTAARSAVLSYEISPVTMDTLNISFDLGFDDDFQFDRDYELLVGWEYLDENGDKLETTLETNGAKSDWFDFYFKTKKINLNQTIRQTILIPGDLQSRVSHIKIHIMNYDQNPVILKIDNVQILNGNRNLVDEGDSTFDSGYNELSTKWEYRKLFDTKQVQFLFKERTALIDEIRLARNELGNLDIPETQLILTLPDINIDFYIDNGKMPDLKSLLRELMRTINQQFKNWKKINPESNIELAGIYILDEYIYGEKAKKMSDVLSFLRQEADHYGWELYGSPYMIFNEDKTVQSTYSEDVFQYFDILWQQPNVFFHHFSRGNIDRNLLIMANDLIVEKKLNVNIESSLPTPEETYGRVMDYFTYGEKYGYINQSKMYYDEAGGYYINATSENPDYRMVYDKLYDFINKSRYGVPINGNFETLNNYQKLNGWKGSCTFLNNGLSKLLNNSYEINLPSNSTVTSEFIYLKEEKDYTLNLTKENKDSISVVIQFYNKQGVFLKGNTIKISVHNESYNFRTPHNVSGITIKITNLSPNSGNIKDLNISSQSDKEKIRLFSDDKFKHIIRSIPPLEYGNYSLRLDYSQHIESTNKILVQNKGEYLLSISYKENLPIREDYLQPKAFLGIETFNKKGEKINIRFSDTFSLNEDVGMQVVELLNFKATWAQVTQHINFPKEVESIKIHIINNQYNNQLVFDNLRFQNSNSSKRYFTNNNLLKEDKWTDLLPLLITPQTPSFYKEFIQINDNRTLEFSALINDEKAPLQPNIDLNIEYFDSEYQPVIKNPPSFVNDFEHIDESEPKYLSEAKSQRYKTLTDKKQKWFNNEWIIYTKQIQVPDNVAYIRISLSTPLETNTKISVLNPYLKFVKEFGNIKME